MKTRVAFSMVLIATCASIGVAQKYTQEKALVSFYSHALLEDITASNTKGTTIFNTANNEIVFSVPMKEFQFAKKLMQEHFNEKYVESEKFPRSTFQGKISGFDAGTTGVQEVKAIGKLTLHGVTKDIDVSGTIEVKDKGIIVKSKFMVKVADYNITVPEVVFQKIAEEVEVTIDFVYTAI